MQAGISKSEESKHSAETNQLRNAEDFAQRRDGQGDDEETEDPVAGAVLNKGGGIGNDVAMKEWPGNGAERREAQNKNDWLRPAADQNAAYIVFPHRRD